MTKNDAHLGVREYDADEENHRVCDEDIEPGREDVDAERGQSSGVVKEKRQCEIRFLDVWGPKSRTVRSLWATRPQASTTYAFLCVYEDDVHIKV